MTLSVRGATPDSHCAREFVVAGQEPAATCYRLACERVSALLASEKKRAEGAEAALTAAKDKLAEMEKALRGYLLAHEADGACGPGAGDKPDLPKGTPDYCDECAAALRALVPTHQPEKKT